MGLQALLRWRSQRVEWCATSLEQSPSKLRHGACNAVDTAVEMELLLVPSKTHNDLLLQCISPHQAAGIPAEANIIPAVYVDAKQVDMTGLKLELPLHKEEPQAQMWDTPSTDGASESGLSCTSAGSGRLEQELALLRLENAKLRCET